MKTVGFCYTFVKNVVHTGKFLLVQRFIFLLFIVCLFSSYSLLFVVYCLFVAGSLVLSLLRALEKDPDRFLGTFGFIWALGPDHGA